MAGIFITIEGPDGAGKSTQAKLLAAYLKSQGRDVILTREPGGTDLAEKIRGILLEEPGEEVAPMTEVLLYAASRAQHVARLILPALKKGTVVISDRFVDSSIAYQAYGREIDPELIWQINRLGTGGLMPDLTIILNVNPQQGNDRVFQRNKLSRTGLDRLEKESSAFQQRVGQGFLAIARNDPERIQVIEAAATVAEVHQAIITLVNQRFSLGNF